MLFSASNSWIQGEVQVDKYGQYKLKYADREVRLTQDPFPLYPGEVLSGRVTKLSVVKQDQERLFVAVQLMKFPLLDFIPVLPSRIE